MVCGGRELRPRPPAAIDRCDDTGENRLAGPVTERRRRELGRRRLAWQTSRVTAGKEPPPTAVLEAR